MKRKSKFIISLFSVLVLLISGLTAAASAISETEVDGSNWMSAVSGFNRITQITIPGTHDSATENISMSAVSRTQSLSITKQLYAGVRYFDIRLKKTGDEYISVHSIVNNKTSYGLFADEMTADDIISDFSSFLEINPQETILMLIKEEGSNAGFSFYTDFYNKYIAPDPGLWYVRNDHIPLLSECRGKIVLLRYNGADPEIFDDTNGGINFTGYPYINNYKTIDFRKESVCNIMPADYIEEEDGPATAYTNLYVQDSYRLPAAQKWTAITSFLSQELSPIEFNICVTSSSTGTPYYNAKIINTRLASYAFEKGGYYGIISMDFANEELCEKIYSVNNFINIPTPATQAPEENAEFAFMGSFFAVIRDVFCRIADLFAELALSA